MYYAIIVAVIVVASPVCSTVAMMSKRQMHDVCRRRDASMLCDIVLLLNQQPSIEFGSLLTEKLHLAVEQGWLEGAKILLAAGARVDTCTKGKSILHHALTRTDDQKNTVELVTVLLAYGAKTSCKCTLGNTPIFSSIVMRRDQKTKKARYIVHEQGFMALIKAQDFDVAMTNNQNQSVLEWLVMLNQDKAFVGRLEKMIAAIMALCYEK